MDALPDLPPGPWTHEPNHVEFIHAGVPCILHRGPLGAWCGYAAVEPGHPWHGLDIGLLGDDPDVHGGITYAKPGEPEGTWLLGFDCSHGGDFVPGLAFHVGLAAITSPHPITTPMQLGEYRDLNYVRRETEKLAEQIVAKRAVASA